MYHAMACITVPIKLSYLGEHSEVRQARSLHSVSSKNGSNLKHMCLSNEMKRDGRQNKEKIKEAQNTRARSHALVVSVTDFSHFEAVLELYLLSC